MSDAFAAHVSPDSTLAMVGWQDSDGDGVFDVADVPLRLEGIGYFDAATSRYHFRGDASAVPLMNRNSSGNQSDITLNRISELQYRIDQGAWQVYAARHLPYPLTSVAFGESATCRAHSRQKPAVKDHTDGHCPQPHPTDPYCHR